MNINTLRLFVVAWSLVLCAACARNAPAPAPKAKTSAPAAAPESIAVRPRPAFERDVAPLLERYCLKCHDGEDSEGGVDLSRGGDLSEHKEAQALFVRIAGVVNSESMPPEKQPQPGWDDRMILAAWVNDSLAALGCGQVQRPISIRRLNRAEYNNTIRDLIGLDLRPADDFPADDVGYGFDNISDVLSTPPILAEMYLAAAENVITEAFRTTAIRERIVNPPPDIIPLAFRRYQAPIRTPRVDKIFRPATSQVDPELKRQQRIYDVLRTFADRAFRRPATHDEVTRLLEIVLSAEKDGESAERALKVGLQAVLASPQFLFRAETIVNRDEPSAPLPPCDFDLASRLSYFLWSSMPDQELYRLAAQGALRRPDTLRSQVTRMLGDRRARALAENFGLQWLQTRKLQEFTPDPTTFPAFDESLRSAMLEETRLFFASILDENRSVLEFLAADYTFVNDRLARHYGIPDVTGPQFRRVSLAGTPRGGVLTQASVLATTSSPTRTSPVKRGKWILETILGAPPAPPPAGVEALKEGQGPLIGAPLRQRMEQHRSNAVCASCHRRMDPLGFGLENFDAIGAWRTHDGGQTVDSSGKLPGGGAFDGPAGLKAALLSRPQAFAWCLAEKMLIYALGRALDGDDRRTLEQIVDRLVADNYRFQTLVLAIVESESFRRRSELGGQP